VFTAVDFLRLTETITVRAKLGCKALALVGHALRVYVSSATGVLW
jgi:hypothetical protein